MCMPRAALLSVLVVLAAVFGISIPSLRSAIVDVRILAMGQSVARGLSLARGTAIARNQRVQFRLDPSGAMVVRTENDSLEIHPDSSASDAGNVDIAVSPPGAHVATFNGMGWSVGNTDGSPSISAVDVQARTLKNFAHPSRRVLLSAAGSVVLCDPQGSADTNLACAQAGEFRAIKAPHLAHL